MHDEPYNDREREDAVDCKGDRAPKLAVTRLQNLLCGCAVWPMSTTSIAASVISPRYQCRLMEGQVHIQNRQERDGNDPEVPGLNNVATRIELGEWFLALETWSIVPKRWPRLGSLWLGELSASGERGKEMNG